MYRHSLSIAVSIVGLAFVLSYACGRPDRGIPAEPAMITPVVEKPVVDLRLPPPEAIEEVAIPSPNLSAELGSFKMTYYWVAHEKKAAKSTVSIFDKTCSRVARVSKRFRRRLRLEGSGRLKDGRLVTKAGGCECEGACYWVAGEDHQWGSGVANRPLKPFRSVAVDPRQIKIGSWLYVVELDGLTMPGAGDEGGFVHDGCVIADDRGGGVRGKQIDFFAARRDNYKNFFRRHKISTVSVYEGGDRCSPELRDDKTRVAASRASI